MPELATIYDYMRSYSRLLGERILQEYPALHACGDAVLPVLEQLLRRPAVPAQEPAPAAPAPDGQPVDPALRHAVAKLSSPMPQVVAA